MNKTQSAIVALAVVELALLCFFIPQLLFRIQDNSLSSEVNNEEIESATLSFYDNSIYAQESALTLEQKIDFANSYDSTITTIYLEKGEKYTANQICSIASGELDDICNSLAGEYPLLKRIQTMDVSNPIRVYGNYLESAATDENDGEVGYADVETVDDYDVDLEPVFEIENVEIRLEPIMYINSKEPDQAFIVWNFSYYNTEDGTTLFMMFDDDTGKLLSITGSLANYNDKPNHSLYSDSKEIVQMIISFYQDAENSVE